MHCPWPPSSRLNERLARLCLRCLLPASHSEPVQFGDSLGAAVDVEFLVDSSHVRLHRPIGDVEFVGDFLLEETLRQQLENLPFPRPKFGFFAGCGGQLLERLHHAPGDTHAHRRTTRQHFMDRLLQPCQADRLEQVAAAPVILKLTL